MYERFTDRARKVMQLANQEAQRVNHDYIGTEHLLLGLALEGSGVAANALRNLGVDPANVRREVEKIIHHGADGPSHDTAMRPNTPRAKKVIELAIDEARNLNHNFVGTEHLLIGLLREQEGVGARVLLNLGLKPDDVRGEVLNLLGHKFDQSHAAAPSGEAPAPPPPLTPEQHRMIQEWVDRLSRRKEELAAAQEFAQAARCRAEAEALRRLLAWYEWARTQT